MRDTNIITSTAATLLLSDHQMSWPDHSAPGLSDFKSLDVLSLSLHDITLSPQDEVVMTLLPKAFLQLPRTPSPSLPPSQYQYSPKLRRTHKKNVLLPYTGHLHPSLKPITTSFPPPTRETPNFLPTSFSLSECQPLDMFFLFLFFPSVFKTDIYALAVLNLIL